MKFNQRTSFLFDGHNLRSILKDYKKPELKYLHNPIWKLSFVALRRAEQFSMEKAVEKISEIIGLQPEYWMKTYIWKARWNRTAIDICMDAKRGLYFQMKPTTRTKKTEEIAKMLIEKFKDL